MKSQVSTQRSLSQSLGRGLYSAKCGAFVRNRAFALVLWSILMVLPVSVLAQEQGFPLPSTTGTLGNKDAGAIAEIKAHLLVVSATGWRGLEGTGTLTYPDGDAHSALLYLRGSKYSRLDITMDSGTRSLRVSGFAGRFQDEKGNPGVLPPATSSAGIVAFSRIWAEAATSSRISLYDQGIYTSSTQSLHRITIEYPLDAEGGSSFSKKTAATDLYFDPNTHLLLFSVDSFSVSTMRRPLTLVTSYGNYQPFEGVSVPTTIKQALNGQDQWTLQLSQVTINTNSPTSTFSF
jgi:hypothetical protein